jgi:hypothetical protein
MKIFSYIIIILAVVTIVINAIKLDFNNLLAGDSNTALTGIIASLCAITIALINLKARKFIGKK